MKNRKWSRCAVTLGVWAVLGSTAEIVFADTAAPKWHESTVIGGYVQGSYVGNLSKDTPQTNQLRVYDANNGFNLNQAQLRLSKPVDEAGAGFSVKLLAGHDAGFIHSAGLGTESSSFDLEEANLTFKVPKVQNLTFTGGKFVTSCGVEVIDSPANLMIEPGYLFFYGMPFTHTGGKFGYTVNDKLSLSAGLVNGWDQVTDGNSGKTIILQVAATPLTGFSASLMGSYGPELFNTGSSTTALPSGNPNISKRSHVDLVLGYTGITKLSLNAEYLWGQDTNVGGTADSGTTPWSGVGLWAAYNVSDYINPGVRFEVFRDQNGAGRLTAGVNQTAKNLTLVNKVNLTKSTFVRLEYRHDWSNAAVFTRNDGSLVCNQNTVSADWVVTF
ncbi:MAG: DUF3138 family protein [Elusimicrobiota bacterium]